MNMTFIMSIMSCLGMLVAFLVPYVVVLSTIRFLFKIPSFVFRKLLHSIAFIAFVVLLYAAKNWQIAVMTCVFILIVLYPIITLLEKQDWYQDFFVQKSKGEIKRSYIMLISMFILIIFILWGMFQKPILAIAAVLMWGIGDAAAALIGVPFGKHKVHWKITDGKKSWEGTIANFLSAFLCGIIIFSLVQKVDLPKAVLFALFGSICGSFIELISPSEYDTITVPLSIGLVLLLFSIIHCI